MKIFTTLILIVSLTLSGCAAPLTAYYSPGLLVTGSGSVHVDDFDYKPNDSGDVEPNQIKNTALGSIKLSENVAPYFTNALASELKYAGYKINSGTIEVVGSINKFVADDFGYSVDWTLDVTYRIIDKNSGKQIAEKNVVTKMNTNKFIDIGNSLNKVIRSNIKEVLNSHAFKSNVG